MSQQESRDWKAAKADIEVDATIVSTLGKGKELAEEIYKRYKRKAGQCREITLSMT